MLSEENTQSSTSKTCNNNNEKDMNHALNSFSSLSVPERLKLNNADAVNSKQPLSSNALNSSANNKKT